VQKGEYNGKKQREIDYHNFIGGYMQNQTHIEMKTERLFLRTITEVDADIVRDSSEDEFETKEAALQWIRWVKNKNDEGRLIVNFYIWLTQTNQCIGRVYIHSKPELNGEVEIGYGISEEHRSNGYATEAAKAVVQFAFEKAGQDVLVAIVKPENIASRHVIEKLGFTSRGVRTVSDENGEDCAFDYFQLYRNDWR
jgi:ribosomal-protein-alanine N-acetyltransferase